jgi:hypothetical protein
MVASNGYHGMCDLSTPKVTDELVAFFNRFVKGASNGFDQTPHVQLWSFDYVFRKGSSIRLWIDAPTGMTGGWSLDFVNAPGVNSIYADTGHPSALVLGQLKGGHAEAPLPACDTVLNQPCRSNQTPVPSGSMTIG